MSTPAFTLTALTGLWGALIGSIAPSHSPLQVLQIAVGEAHTCAVLTDMSLWCWGSNSEGQLGLGDGTRESHEPVRIEALPFVKSVSLSENHTCAIDKDDNLWCWGENPRGVLNVGFTPSLRVPVPTLVTGFPKVQSVSLGKYDLCTIDLQQSLWCSGRFNGVKGERNQRLMERATSVSVGVDHVCATDARSDLYCWGFNSDGVLGLGNTFRFGAERPQLVTGIPLIKGVSAGYSHTCAADVSGHLWCWGANSGGQLGDPDSFFGGDSIGVPHLVPRLSDVTSVSVGSNRTCAILSSGKLDCWGDGRSFTQGAMHTGSEWAEPTPVETDLTVTSVAQSPNASHTCAIFSNGLSRCWGRNTYGQLGYGALVDGDFGHGPSDDINNLPFHEFWR